MSKLQESQLWTVQPRGCTRIRTLDQSQCQQGKGDFCRIWQLLLQFSERWKSGSVKVFPVAV